MDAVGDAEDRPVADDRLPCRVRRLRVELRDRVRPGRLAERERGHVELVLDRRRRRVRVDDPVDGHAAGVGPTVPIEERSSDLPDELDSNRSLPAATGVWMVKTEFADARQSAVERRAGSDELAGALCEEERRMASLRCQTAGSISSARSARIPPTPRTSSWWRASRGRGRRGCGLDRPVGVVVLRHVGVEQEHWRTRPTWAHQTATVRSRPAAER